MSDDLVSRLKRLARIARRALETNKCMSIWCADPDTLEAAATALTEARAEIERQAGAIRLLDERCAQYERRAEQAERALSVLAPVRDMLILCGELDGMRPGETMVDYLRRLIDEVAGVKSLRARVREAVGPFAHPHLSRKATGNVEGDRSVVFGRDEAELTLGNFRAARQLMEDLK